MATARDLNSLLLEMMKQNLDCDVGDLVSHCPEVTWNQVFLSLDNLNRAGQVTLRQQGPGRYKVGLVSQPYPLERRR